jgi:hypothetical protein
VERGVILETDLDGRRVSHFDIVEPEQIERPTGV